MKEVRAKKVRDRLFKQYSSVFAKLMMQEFPKVITSVSVRERYRFYESALIEQKKILERMTKRTRWFHKSVIKSVLIDYSKDVKGETTERILYYIYSLKILDEPFKMMKSPRWWIRAEAARDLGLLHARRALVPLTAALEDSSPDVQFQAIQSLLMIVGVTALQNILRLTKSISQWTAVALSVIILEYREDAAQYFLESLTSPSPSVKLFSITMLAQIGFVSAVEPLIQFCSSHPELILYKTAIEALGRLGDERALNLLLLNGQNPNISIRFSAVQALGRLGAKEGINIVIERFTRGDIIEKRIAAHALGNMGEEGIHTLYEALNSTEERTRLIALEVTEEIEQGRRV